MKRILSIIILLPILFSSCGINSYILFRDSWKIESELPEVTYSEDYVLAPNDVISMRIYNDEGFALIDPSVQTNSAVSFQMNQNGGRSVGFPYRIEYDGMVNFPTIGRVKLAGKTLREAEFALEELMTEYFIKPFVLMNIINNRVIVSPGSGGSAQVIYLQNTNTTVLEALSLAGGITERGNSKKINLIRKVGDSREIYKIDLSKVSGIEMADMIVQANDIIYVQPRRDFAREFVKELAPYLSILSSSLLIYSVFANGSN